ncbi:hypothetical protein ACFQGA_06830 [Marinobacter koreensis]|uniref:hypothetical protein n=1 Tax=Marinobacter koreensis TaxID=335974 RepID=UPI00361EB797
MNGNLARTMTDIDLDQACIPSNYSRLIARELGLQERDVADLLKLTQLSVDQFLQDDTLLTPGNNSRSCKTACIWRRMKP